MSDPPPVIVKLGGSVLTRKREAPRIRLKVLARLAEEIASASVPLVLLHGAGSFGHPGAVRFGLALPPSKPADPHRVRGAAIVGREVRKLHQAVLTALVDAGASPGSLPAAALALNRAGTLERLEVGPFETLLSRQMTPVSFGDVVPDVAWGFSILSADTLAVELARHLKATRVLFVSDVAGVFAPTPSGATRQIVPELTPAALTHLAPAAGVADVTGGIRTKVAAMLELGDLGIQAGLISGLSHGSLSRALKGEKVYGSWSGPDS
ncbi:MAG TPA: isopentenyl phosphate kinase [Thermoplasmata archaeon]|nr:isopentenyl phosphate kinase [Thermoplasmata archaeon]